MGYLVTTGLLYDRAIGAASKNFRENTKKPDQASRFVGLLAFVFLAYIVHERGSAQCDAAALP
ncbi:hypothetical protein PpSQ1_15105 [Pseudomonas putida]|nr:hypothetical protein PpSQ1_15105 [Pseudomonas putida]